MVSASHWGKRGHDLVTGRVLLMGIVNVTPDSFSDGGQYAGQQAAVDHARQLAGEGADIIDIGGESTRPGADLVAVEEELERVIPVIEALAGKVNAKISIDTRKAQVMARAIKAGADIINDVSALSYDKDSLEVAASVQCPIILMHGKGDPKTMQDKPDYEDVVSEVHDYLLQRIRLCEGAGIARSRLVADPGIGFGKTLSHNLTLLANLHRFHDLDVPLLLGASRKRFIGSLSGEEDPQQRAAGSIAAALAGVSRGVQILRIHDVEQTHQALAVWRAIEKAGP